MLGPRLRHAPAVLAGLVVVGLAAAAVGVARSPDAGVVLPDPISRDLQAIMARDTLEVLASYNSTSYFLYRGEPMGYEYELLKDFAESNGIVFRIRVVPRDSLLYYLNAGEGDIAAARLVTSREDTLKVSFTAPLYETDPAVVQQTAPFDSLANPIAAAAVAGTTPADIARLRRGTQVPIDVRARAIRDPRELAGERVFVPEGDPYADRLVELEDDITGDIEVDTTSESLIRQVARGNIELTVAQENVADLEAGYFSNLAITPTIGAPSGIGWADVAYWLLQKSRAEVYNRPEVRHGYCRGLEPVQYVQRIMDRYATYAQFLKDERA